MKSILQFFKKIIDNIKRKRKLKKQLKRMNDNDPFIYR